MNLEHTSPVYVLTCTDARELARVRASYRSRGFTLRVNRSASFVGRFVANVWDPAGDWVGTFESFHLPSLSAALAECIAVPVPFGYRPPPPVVPLPVIPPSVLCHWLPDSQFTSEGIACGAGRGVGMPSLYWQDSLTFAAVLASPSLHVLACKACARAYDERNASA